MDLSRRSLAVSLALHLSLVGGGILWIRSQKPQPKGPSVVAQGLSQTQVVSRPVRVSREVSEPSSNSLKRGERTPQNTPLSKEQGRVESASRERPAPETLPQFKPSLSAQESYPVAKRTAPKRKSGPAPSSQTGSDEEVQEKKNTGPRGWGPVKVSPQPSTTPGEGGTGRRVTRRARPLAQPEYNLSERFPNLKSVSVQAEFRIEEDGSYEPTLLSSTGNPTADVVILAKLLEYEWLPALEKGEAVKDVRVLDISLDD